MSYKEEFLRDFYPDPEQPFPPEEFAARLTRIRARMAEDGIDLLFVQSPEGLNYITGYQCEWYQAQSPKQWPATSGVAIHVDHDRFILFDTEREKLITRYTTVSTDTRIFPPATMRDGGQFIVQELAAEGWIGGTVGLEFWSYRPNRVISERFEARFREAGCAVKDASDILREVRWVKSPAEMACIEEAARIACIGLEAAKASIQPGVMELEVYGAAVHAMVAAGGENPGITMPVLSGKKTASPHAMASRKKIQAGELVLVDVSGVFKRYHCNMARTFALGEPAADVMDLAERAVGSMDLIRDMIRPNLPVAELGRALIDYYEGQGIWQHRGWIGGYEMGIAFPPDWVGSFVFDPLSEINADRVFEPGTAINYENQFFLPRLTGLFFQIETIAFLEDRAKLMSDIPYGLTVIE